MIGSYSSTFTSSFEDLVVAAANQSHIAFNEQLSRKLNIINSGIVNVNIKGLCKYFTHNNQQVEQYSTHFDRVLTSVWYSA